MKPLPTPRSLPAIPLASDPVPYPGGGRCSLLKSSSNAAACLSLRTGAGRRGREPVVARRAEVTESHNPGRPTTKPLSSPCHRRDPLRERARMRRKEFISFLGSAATCLSAANAAAIHLEGKLDPDASKFWRHCRHST